jgi:hypothetical protein
MFSFSVKCDALCYIFSYGVYDVSYGFVFFAGCDCLECNIIYMYSN